MKKTAWRTMAMPTCAICGKRLPRIGISRIAAPGIHTHIDDRCTNDWSKEAHDALLPDCTQGCTDLTEHPGLDIYYDESLTRHIAEREN